MTTQTQTLRQPPVFKLASFTAACERFGFYILSYSLVLYVKEVFGITDTAAFTLFGVFTALSYVTNALGGYLADNIFGIRRCIILGLISEGLGLCLLALPFKSILPLALAFVIIGVGLFKTGPTHLLARSYEEKDPRTDSGFTIYYMIMNVGGFVSSLLVGYIHQFLGWPAAFLLGGIIIYLGLFFYYIFRKTAIEPDSEVGKIRLSSKTWFMVLAGTITGIIISSFFVSHTSIAYGFFTLATILVLAYFAFEIFKSPKDEKLKIIACLALILMGFVYFVLYYQAFTSFVLFVDRCTTRDYFGFTIPTQAFFSINPIFVIIWGPILAAIYNALAQRKKDLPVTTKFSAGLLVATITFFFLALSGFFPSDNAKVSLIWMILAYGIFYTLGEMLISALSFAMITKIAPKRMYGVMLGSWFLIACSLSASLSGLFAGITNVPDSVHDPLAILHIYTFGFFKIGLAALVCTVIAFIAAPHIKRIAKL